MLPAVCHQARPDVGGGAVSLSPLVTWLLLGTVLVGAVVLFFSTLGGSDDDDN